MQAFWGRGFEAKYAMGKVYLVTCLFLRVYHGLTRRSFVVERLCYSTQETTQHLYFQCPFTTVYTPTFDPWSKTESSIIKPETTCQRSPK